MRRFRHLLATRTTHVVLWSLSLSGCSNDGPDVPSSNLDTNIGGSTTTRKTITGISGGGQTSLLTTGGMATGGMATGGMATGGMATGGASGTSGAGGVLGNGGETVSGGTSDARASGGASLGGAFGGGSQGGSAAGRSATAGAPTAGAPTAGAAGTVAYPLRMLFRTEQNESSPRLYLVEANETQARSFQVSPADPSFELQTNPVLSPDGTRAAFVLSSQSTYQSKMYVADLRRSEAIVLQPIGPDYSEAIWAEFGLAAWSPDSKKLAFIRRDVNDAQPYLFFVDLSQANPGTPIRVDTLGTSFYGPDWPRFVGNDHLTFRARLPDLTEHMLISDTSGNTVRSAVVVGTSADGGWIWPICVSPNQKHLAFGLGFASLPRVVDVAMGAPYAPMLSTFVPAEPSRGLDSNSDCAASSDGRYFAFFTRPHATGDPELTLIPVLDSGLGNALVVTGAGMPHFLQGSQAMVYSKANQIFFAVLGATPLSPTAVGPGASRVVDSWVVSADDSQIAFVSRPTGGTVDRLHHSRIVANGPQAATVAVDAASSGGTVTGMKFSPDGSLLLYQVIQGSMVEISVTRTTNLPEAPFVPAPGLSFNDGDRIFFTPDSKRILIPYRSTDGVAHWALLSASAPARKFDLDSSLPSDRTLRDFFSFVK